MEILTSSTASCRIVVNLRWKIPENGSNPCQLKLPTSRERKILFARTNQSSGSLRFSSVDKFLKNLNHGEGSRSLDSFGGLKNGNSKVFSGKSSGYVVGGEDDVGRITENGDSATKPKLIVHYEKAGCENVNSSPVLFLPGFGVGSFHYEKQLKDLGRDHRVWAIDFLGQGMSLPVENPTLLSKDGGYLRDQVRNFIEEVVKHPYMSSLFQSAIAKYGLRHIYMHIVIGEPVYVVGNSLGGFVALYFAASNPHLVKGVTLLNATPFWGLLPNPIRSPILARIFPWSGTFPLPANVRKLTEFLWQKISDPKSIAEILKQVYTDHSTNIDKVFSRILEITQHPAAAASFASIMFAPQGQLSFRETLARCKMSDVPICLVYGKEDPWVKPVWGLQVKRQVPEAPYYEISPAGHCPHDEVPEAVNYLLRGWIKNLESHGSVALPLHDDAEVVENSIARDLEFVREGSRKSVIVRFFGSRHCENEAASFTNGLRINA
ncbi:hypothetical protein OIU78_008121 [Salix suchowensis]|nr:hypothetical protein OIU78_008121 [Salix suchowensis]